MRTPSNQDKAEVWQAYRRGQPTRVPVRLNTNPRVFLQNPELNTEGYTFEQAAGDARSHVEVQLRWQLHLATGLNRYTDSPVGLPEVWDVGLRLYNVGESAAMGAPVYFPEGQVPCTEPVLDEGNKHDIFDVDIEDPLSSGYLKRCLRFWHEMDRVCAGMRFEGRPVRLAPWAPIWTDGPVTLACNLRGSGFMLDLLEDPEYADRLMAFLTESAIQRRRAFLAYWGDRISPSNGLADDSCALLSAEMYRDRVLPHHRRYCACGEPDQPRSIHLCGNASHLFPIIREGLGVESFDTGFPIDHGRVRRDLGEGVEISGGPDVDLLMRGSPEEVYRRAAEILGSGVMAGGRFILQEGNNLPPNTPEANLAAMYEACLELGNYQ